jgi:hypothetical protein
VSVDGLQYTALNNDGAAAAVHITGRMRVELSNSSDRPPVNHTLPFRHEEGTWRYCPSAAARSDSLPDALGVQAELSGTYASDFGMVTLRQQGPAVTGSWTTPSDDAECSNCVGEITEGMTSPGRLAFKWLRTWNGARGAASCGVTGEEIRCAYTWDGHPPGAWTMVRE